MMLANHVIDKLVIDNHTAQILSWVQGESVFGDRNRMNLNSTVKLKYLPIVEPDKEGIVYDFP